MPSVTIPGASSTPVTFSSNDSAPYANALASVISTGLASGTLTLQPYVSGSTAPGPASGTGGAVLISSATTSVAIPTTDSAILITSTTPTSITGGAAGLFAVAGSAGLTYTNITPSGSAIDYITAGDGSNLITTSTAGTGNYAVNTGSGSDSISVFGNAVINAGTGSNSVSLAGGNSLVYSEGFDSITGSTVVGGGGTDTLSVGSGQATINPGTSNFFIFGASTTTNPLIFMPGSGADTISVGSGGGNVYAGTAGGSILFGGAGGPGSAPTALHGSASGDQIYSIGAGVVFATAGAGNETITGAGGSPNGFSVPGSTANNQFTAGSGNDTLIAGAGRDTLVGGSGSAVMISGTGADTFSFQFGNGGQDTITGFKASDTLVLSQFGITSVTPTTSGGSAVISLSDGTKITLSGVTSLNPSQVVLK